MYGLRECVFALGELNVRHRHVLIFALVLLGACADKEDPDGQDTVIPPVMTADGSAGTPPAMDASAPATSMDGSTSLVVGADAAPNTPAQEASTPAASDASSTDAISSADATIMPPLLPDPNMPGPYEVVKLENVGAGFENPPTAANDRGDGLGCMGFIQLFGEPADAARDYALFGPNYKVELYTVYYPKSTSEGQTFPILSWANGTCAKTVGYEAMLKHIASHGFIVVATNSRYTGSGAFQRRGIDFISAENDRADSPLYKRVDASKVGIFGHSQGGGSTGAASADPRVKSSVLMHGGSGSMLHAPALFLTGEMDNPTGVRRAYDAARGPTAFGNLKMSNHITMMKEPTRMAPEVLAWFRFTLLDDEVAKKWYVGADCLLCTDPEWVYAQKQLGTP